MVSYTFKVRMKGKWEARRDDDDDNILLSDRIIRHGGVNCFLKVRWAKQQQRTRAGSLCCTRPPPPKTETNE